MKSELQLCAELATEVSALRLLRKRTLSKTLWKKIGSRVFYTQKGEHAVRNELMKEMLSGSSQH